MANSLIVGALALTPSASGTSQWQTIALIGAGLLITAAWLLITVYGWAVMRRHAEIASAFTAEHFKHLPNPFAEIIYHRSGPRIHFLALVVIGTFIFIYLGLGLTRLSG